MSAIPQRKPDTPLNTFYSLGKYESSLPNTSEKLPMGRPGGAATLIDRNVREHDDINIKPHFTNTFEKSCYKPGKHLDARKEYRET